MTRRMLMSVLGGLAAGARGAFQTEESFRVYGEPPRLLLPERRLRLIRREQDRQSARWRAFDALLGGGASVTEPGFAWALCHQTTRRPEAARRAAEWARGGADDLRQLALVYDWCRAAIPESQSSAIVQKLVAALDRPPRTGAVSEASARALAAIAVSDSAPEASERELKRAIQKWWRGEIIPALKSGQDALPRAEVYAAVELLHAVRDGLLIELRESLPEYFRQLPTVELLSYYPAPNPEPENAYHIPAVRGGRADMQQAALARAADLALVAYDPNALENQFLQGWAMHDRFLMRGVFGAPYEFLWANPYQPGLSYYDAPRVAHDELTGRLFVRSGWGEDAWWLGLFGGELQIFVAGKVRVVPVASAEPMQFGDTAVLPAGRLTLQSSARTVFIVGGMPRRAYRVEAERRKAQEVSADPGGILKLQFDPAFAGGIRMKTVGGGS